MTVEIPTETWLWRLKPEGTCGVGDYTRGLSRNLNMRILDHSKGERPSGAPVLVHWVPTGWTGELDWFGPVFQVLRAVRPRRVVVMLHEMWRSQVFNSPRGLFQHVHDLLALRVILAHADHAIVTTGDRKHLLEATLRVWRLPLRVDVSYVPSNVHDADPDTETRVPEGRPTVALFARAGGGVLAEALASTVERLLLAVPGARVVLLGSRKETEKDAVMKAFQDRQLLERVEVTGMLTAEGVRSALAAAHAGLALHDTGIAGRRGTVAAMLASGLPVVAARGRETDAPWENTPAVLLPVTAQQPDPGALARALAVVLAEEKAAQLRRRQAARSFYLAAEGWEHLRKVLTQQDPSWTKQPASAGAH